MADTARMLPEDRYRNALLWIRTIAGMHYFGDAFNPEHMRALANLAADALDLRGKDIPDFEERMADAKRRAREMADAPGYSVVTAMAGQDYYDEDGRFHHHDPNSRTQQFTCSEGHAWVEVSTSGCEPCGTEPTLTVRLVQPKGGGEP